MPPPTVMLMMPAASAHTPTARTRPDSGAGALRAMSISRCRGKDGGARGCHRIGRCAGRRKAAVGSPRAALGDGEAAGVARDPLRRRVGGGEDAALGGL